jgi:hypothetical protein
VPAAVALVLAIGLVLALAGGEEDVVVDEPGTTTRSEVDRGGAGRPPRRSEKDGSSEAEAVEAAVVRYIEAAERGDVPAPSLPTSDELTIRDLDVEGTRAVARLAGGAELLLRQEDGTWRVTRARPGRATAPTPPSNG